MEKEYIQLPALKRDLDPDVVKALWAFIQLPEEYQANILMDDAEGSESPFEGNSFMTS